MKTLSVSPCLPALPESGGVADGAARENAQQADGVVDGARGVDDARGAADIDDVVGGGEAVLRRALPSPSMPSVSEIREHKATHLPYTSWCDECVMFTDVYWCVLMRTGVY